ncbi:unnamed protein product [Prorocentrum cordatum]|uniref:Uncharacterized protein n=1 Tax=Prorocentrum cordatum TaxID=2364126 RepID=A0ABN9SHM5_9DINO|nr:unnamed protein product [Polarella glacialis]
MFTKDEVCQAEIGNAGQARVLFDKSQLSDPILVDRFCQKMWAFKADPTGQSIVTFGPPPKRPGKPWVSTTSWGVVQMVAPLVRLRHKGFALERLALLRNAWFAFASVLPAGYEPAADAPGAAPPPALRGWRARGASADAARVLAASRRLSARLRCTARAVGLISRQLVKADR